MRANDHGRDLMAALDELALDTDGDGNLTRLYLSPAHARAAARVRGWMERAGLSVRVDALGTLVGRLEGERPGLPALVLGSHIDTVRDGGKYDGALGVLAAIAAVRALRAESGGPRPFAIEVMAFGDEENVRFPTALLSSRAVAGLVAPVELDVVDGDGISVRAALEAAGHDPATLANVARRAADILAYVELHIEQGPVLEAENLPLAVVTAINGRIRLDVTVTGTAGHAGTVPMNLRRDALVGAADMVAMVRETGGSHDGIVATIGQFEVRPGASNVIPGEVFFTIDLRSGDDGQRDTVGEELRRSIQKIAETHDLAVSVREVYRQPATPMHAGLRGQLLAAVGRLGLAERLLPSGAGHDAMAMAQLCPAGMLFLRCAGGVSHNPAESITVEDADIAVRALVETVRGFDPAAL